MDDISERKPVAQQCIPSTSPRSCSTDNMLNDQREQIITCLVFGAGLGRLVQYCIDAVSSHESSKAEIHAVDANPTATNCLKSYFSDYDSNGSVSVVIHDSFTLFPGMQGEDLPLSLRKLRRKCDLIVSELLGCFGCDEFLPELTSTLCNLFLVSDGVCIPKDWRSYIVPVQSYKLYNSLILHSSSATYTSGVPEDCVFMCPPQLLWEGSCYDYKTPQCSREGVKFPFSPFMVKESHCPKTLNHYDLLQSSVNSSYSAEYTVHGIIGYFTSNLYDNVCIDTQHCNGRNSFHWECFYMPLKEPLLLPPHKTMADKYVLSASVKRVCGIVKPSNSISWSCSSGLCYGTKLSLKYSWEIELHANKGQENVMELQERKVGEGNVIFLIHSKNFPDAF